MSAVARGMNALFASQVIPLSCRQHWSSSREHIEEKDCLVSRDWTDGQTDCSSPARLGEQLAFGNFEIWIRRARKFDDHPTIQSRRER